ncbi:MAG: Non-ous end joining protein Ku [Ramlibacter sp.]|jgi:DNA end-binding protein Ku|nr:Non-ous end joining protein Ku [Ramlibacter sp.]
MATASTRTVWKGAISFGLVHIPVALYTATAETRPKFNLIDKSSMSPVGNKQVNKTTGEAVQREELVKGIEVDDGQFVVLSKEEIRSALPKSTQTIEIEAFVDADAIPPTYYQKPYYVAPVNKGQKAYLLLRDTLRKTGKAGLARVVISTKQHLAALVPFKDGLALNLLRWADEIRDFPASVMPDAGTAAPTDKELRMAEQLVNDMADAWSPDLFHDEFKEKLNELVQAKARAGDVATLQPLPGEEVAQTSAEVIDLTELLKRSLKTPAAAKSAAAARPVRSAAANDETPPAKRAAASKTPSKARATVKPSPRRKSA